MLIWGCLLIPIIISTFLLIAFKHKIVWWEIVAPFIISALIILVVKTSAEHSMVADTEWWGTYVSNATYYEDWDERVSCRHPIYCSRSYPCGKSTCTSIYVCGHHHAYDVDYHPEYWTLTTVTNDSIYISKNQYDSLVRQFGNSIFVDLHRDYHLDDGDKYVTRYDGTESKMEPFFVEKTYVNKVQASSSVFNFPEIDVKTIPVVSYPTIHDRYKQNHILGDSVLIGNDKALAERKLAIYNAKLGLSKQAKVLYILYKNKPLQTAIDQESYWKGGNKNELVITVGLDNENKVQWSYVFSWTDVNSLKVEIRNSIMEYKDKPFDILQSIDTTSDLIQKKWKRKHFKDFDYLTVEPPLWGYILAFVLTLLASAGFGYFAIVNEFEQE